jgi:hypothetical protein
MVLPGGRTGIAANPSLAPPYLDFTGRHGLLVLVNRPLNAFTSTGAHRLAEYPSPPGHRAALANATQLLETADPAGGLLKVMHEAEGLRQQIRGALNIPHVSSQVRLRACLATWVPVSPQSIPIRCPGRRCAAGGAARGGDCGGPMGGSGGKGAAAVADSVGRDGEA